MNSYDNKHCNNKKCMEHGSHDKQCPNGDKCALPNCTSVHPGNCNPRDLSQFSYFSRAEMTPCYKLNKCVHTKYCKYKICTKNDCSFFHPGGKRCPFDTKCRNKKCEKQHPDGHNWYGQYPELCRFGKECRSRRCQYVHHNGRKLDTFWAEKELEDKQEMEEADRMFELQLEAINDARAEEYAIDLEHDSYMSHMAFMIDS